MADFPAHLFRMDGDTAAIRDSAGKWSSFGTAATDAGEQITSLDTSEFVGQEGDMFREGLNDDMPRHLAITGDAFGKVSTALRTFADTLGGLQDQMRPLAQRAPSLWEALQAAQGRADRAAAADRQHERDVADRPEGDTTPDTYHSDSGAANSALSGAQAEWDACVGSANGLTSQMNTAVDECVRAIKVAEDMRFKENPKWWDIGGQFTNFVRDNAELLAKLSGALKIVSLVAGVLSFIPVLAPIMGPIALGTALLASAIDLSIWAATGQGDLTTILIDVGLNLLPVAGKLVNRARALNAVGEVGYGATDLGQAVRNARANLPDPTTLRNGAVFEFEQNGRRMLSDVGWSRPGWHAERVVWDTLQQRGVRPDQIRRIFSELEPCIIPTPAAGCRSFIARMFPDARVTWAFEYGDAASRARGNAAREALFNTLFNRVGG